MTDYEYLTFKCGTLPAEANAVYDRHLRESMRQTQETMAPSEAVVRRIGRDLLIRDVVRKIVHHAA